MSSISDLLSRYLPSQRTNMSRAKPLMSSKEDNRLSVARKRATLDAEQKKKKLQAFILQTGNPMKTPADYIFSNKTSTSSGVVPIKDRQLVSPEKVIPTLGAPGSQPIRKPVSDLTAEEKRALVMESNIKQKDIALKALRNNPRQKSAEQSNALMDLGRVALTAPIQAAIRTSPALVMANKYGLTSKNKEGVWTPKSDFAKFFVGKEPVKDIKQTLRGTAKGFAKTKNIRDFTKNIGAGAFLYGGLALDATPLGGAKKTVEKQAAKIIEKRMAEGMTKEVAKKLTEKELAQLGEKGFVEMVDKTTKVNKLNPTDFSSARSKTLDGENIVNLPKRETPPSKELTQTSQTYRKPPLKKAPDQLAFSTEIDTGQTDSLSYKPIKPQETPPVKLSKDEQYTRFAETMSKSPKLTDVERPKYLKKYAIKKNEDVINAGKIKYEQEGQDNFIKRVTNPDRAESLTIEDMGATIEIVKRMRKMGGDPSDLIKVISMEAGTESGQKIQFIHKMYQELEPEMAINTAKKLVEQENADRKIMSIFDVGLKGTSRKPLEVAPERIKQIDDVAQELAILRKQKEALETALNKALNPKKDYQQLQRQLAEKIKVIDSYIDIKSRKLQQTVEGIVPNSFWAKVKKVRVMSMLGTVSRSLRDALSNVGNVGAEKASDVIGSLAETLFERDSVKSVSRRMLTLKEAGRSLKEGYRTARLETLDNVVESRYGTSAQIADEYFVNKHKIIGGAISKVEKVFGLSMSIPDKTLFQLRYDDTMKGLLGSGMQNFYSMKTLKEIAEHEASRITLTNKNMASEMLKGLQKSLNKIGFGKSVGFRGSYKEFGLGDLILPFVQVPGAIAARAGEYIGGVPLAVKKLDDYLKAKRGFEVAAKEVKLNPDVARFLHDFTAPLTGANIANMPRDKAALLPFAQRLVSARRDFYQSFGRATVGSTFIGAGVMLGGAGVIKAKNTFSKEDPLMQKVEGQTGYTINLSGLKRFMSGKDPKEISGDYVVNWEWLQPVLSPLAAGVGISESQKKTMTKEEKSIGGATSDASRAIGEAVFSSMDVVVEQPVFQSIKKFMQGARLGAAIKELAASTPASFVPTLMGQIRRTIDNTNYDTWDEDTIQLMKNKLLTKIPGVPKSMLPPERKAPLGETSRPFSEDTPWTIRAIKSMVFPFRLTKTQKASLERELLRLMESQGVKDHIPNVQTMKSITLGGKNIAITAQERQQMQEMMGSMLKYQLENAMKNPKYETVNDYEKQRHFANRLDDMRDGAKMIPFLRALGVNLPPDVPQGLLIKTGKEFKKAVGNKDFKLLSKEQQVEAFKRYIKGKMIPEYEAYKRQTP